MNHTTVYTYHTDNIVDEAADMLWKLRAHKTPFPESTRDYGGLWANLNEVLDGPNAKYPTPWESGEYHGSRAEKGREEAKKKRAEIRAKEDEKKLELSIAHVRKMTGVQAKTALEYYITLAHTKRKKRRVQ